LSHASSHRDAELAHLGLLRELESGGVRGYVEVLHLALQLLELVGKLLLLRDHSHVNILLVCGSDLLLLLLEHFDLLGQSQLFHCETVSMRRVEMNCSQRRTHQWSHL
jgi:hypothetical protein